MDRLKRFWYWLAPWYSKLTFYGDTDGSEEAVWCRMGFCKHGRSVDPVDEDITWFVYEDGTVVYREGEYSFGEVWVEHERATQAIQQQRSEGSA